MSGFLLFMINDYSWLYSTLYRVIYCGQIYKTVFGE